MQSSRFLHIAILAIAAIVSGCIKNDLPLPIVIGSIVEFEVEGQVGETQIDEEKRTVTIEVADSVDLQHLRLRKLTLSNETTAPIQEGSIFSCLDSLALMLETYQQYPWMLYVKQPFTPDLQMIGQLGNTRIKDDTVRIYVSNLNVAAATKLRLAAGPATYVPDITDPANLNTITDVDVTVYGRTTRYTIVLQQIDKPFVEPTSTDPWAKFCHVSADVMTLQNCEAGIEYRLEGETDWSLSATVPVEAGFQSYKITLTDLEPGVTYEYRAVADTLVSAIATFDTDDMPMVPNLNFDSWHLDDKNQNPWASGQQAYWGTGNSGVTGFGVNRASNNTPVDDAVSGKAAKLLTYDGITMVKLAAGSIYTGDYATNMGAPLKSTKMGRGYRGRPTTLSGWYKYNPSTINTMNTSYYKGSSVLGQGDKAHIYIILINHSDPQKQWFGDEIESLKTSNAVVAYGELLISERQPKYTQFHIELEYRTYTKRPTHIILCATSSYLGNSFTGGGGSTLWIDEFELGFDYVP